MDTVSSKCRWLCFIQCCVRGVNDDDLEKVVKAHSKTSTPKNEEDPLLVHPLSQDSNIFQHREEKLDQIRQSLLSHS